MERILKENWEDFSPFENIIGVEMQRGQKFYLHPNADGFVPINLKDHADYDYVSTDHLESGFEEVTLLKGNKKVYEFDSMQEMIAWATS